MEKPSELVILCFTKYGEPTLETDETGRSSLYITCPKWTDRKSSWDTYQP